MVRSRLSVQEAKRARAEQVVATPITVKRKVYIVRRARGRKTLAPVPRPADEFPPGHVPRVAQLMALAIRFDRLIREGKVRDQTELARLGHVTQPRMTQIMNLLHLAPDIQEAVLFLPRTINGRDRIHERLLRPIAAEDHWSRQRKLWGAMVRAAGAA